MKCYKVIGRYIEFSEVINFNRCVIVYQLIGISDLLSLINQIR